MSNLLDKKVPNFFFLKPSHFHLTSFCIVDTLSSLFSIRNAIKNLLTESDTDAVFFFNLAWLTSTQQNAGAHRKVREDMFVI